MINQFAAAFGPIFDSAVPTVTDHIQEEPLTLGGIEFVITPTAEAFDIEIPEINAVYTHMLGHNCHSIVAGASHANAMIQQLALPVPVPGLICSVFSALPLLPDHVPNG